MTYPQALAYLETLVNYERQRRPRAMRAVRLERMQRLCERLDLPQRKFRAILVAGTNGKGSICAMIYSMLRAAGVSVGLYTSPHLEDLRERIRVWPAGRQPSPGTDDGADWISPEAFAEALREVRRVLKSDPNLSGLGAPTHFEVLTAMAFVYFARQGVSVAVLEVGLGGRLDATNVVEPVVSVIGPIGLDHTDVLGEDVLAIAREKAGVMRAQGTTVIAAQDPAVSHVLREMACAERGHLLEYGRDITAQTLRHGPHEHGVAIRSPRGHYEDVSLSLIGRHQAENAALAVAAIETLAEEGIPYSAVRSGLAQAQWPGRLELVRSDPLVVFDGAHNAQAATALRQTLEELWPDRRIRLVLGLSADKSVRDIGEVLAPIASAIACTASAHPRALDPHTLAGRLRAFHERIDVIRDPVDAYTYVLNTAAPREIVVVTGSLFLVGQLRAMERRASAQRPRARRMWSASLRRSTSCPS